MPSKSHKILVTAGNTQVPIDKVRSITNIFKGKTGLGIAVYLASEGHQVHLLTSNLAAAENAYGILARFFQEAGSLTYAGFRTYDELLATMETEIRSGEFDTVIHSAAVSDYYVDGVFYEEKIAPDSVSQTRLHQLDQSGKVGSDFETLFLRLRQTKKIVDLIRQPWGFDGTLVKFKLQVGMTDEELISVAYKSMQTSQADIIVANCLEWAKQRAIIISDSPVREMRKIEISRDDLPNELADVLENIWLKK